MDLSELRLFAPAKINLYLKVLGKRLDGYHNLDTLMIPISLYDEIRLRFGQGSQNSLVCDHPQVPQDETNIAYRAAILFQQQVQNHEPVQIILKKNIPVAAGLGGGSSNAASVLLGLNQRAEYPFSLQQLQKMGCSLGADVPFFIVSQPARARGIGERLEPICIIENFKILVVSFDFGVSTADVYRKLNLGLTKCKKIHMNISFDRAGKPDQSWLCNDLETVTEADYPVIRKAKSMLREEGAWGSLMSGSGPTVFGLFYDEDTARRAQEKLKTQMGWNIHWVEMVHTQEQQFE